MPGRHHRSLRRLSTGLLIATVFASAAIAGCARTVAGQVEQPIGGNGPTAPSLPSHSTSTAPGTDPGETSGPDVTDPPQTTESTETDTSTIATTPGSTSAPDTGKRGVPPKSPQWLRKAINERSGVIVDGDDGKTVDLLTFAVTAIDPDMGRRCTNPATQPSGTALIGVQIKYTVAKTFDPKDSGQLGFRRDYFSITDADGTAHGNTGSTAATRCLAASAVLPEELSAGMSGTAWIALDSPVRYGVVRLRMPSLQGSGGWEFVIPGSQ